MRRTRTRTPPNAASSAISRRDNAGIFIPPYEIIDIADIRPYPGNPRDNEATIPALVNSIRQFGFTVPVILDADGELVAGHTRYEAAKVIGMTALPSMRAEHLTEEQLRQFRIIDNKIAEMSGWNQDALATEFGALRDSGIDFTQFGFTQEEIDCLSDVVTDDCLSGVGMAPVTTPTQDAANRRAPAQARFVLSEFVFFVPSTVYRRWAQEVRATLDYDEKAIQKELQDRLGLTPYLEAEE